jgi:(1->4)-alpha-D-glucan 1-alpha-D-glucosylmutase
LGLILDFGLLMSAFTLPITLGGSTCWNGDPLRRTQPRSTSTGISCRIAAAGGCCCRSSASSYGQALERGEIELRYDPDEGSFSAWYFEHRLPIAPERFGELLRMVVKEAGAEQSAPGTDMLALAARYAGPRHPNRKEAPDFKARLRDISEGAEIIARGVDAYRAGPDRANATLALHHLLERQHYRLAHWRLASSDINYRRFFDINTLAGLRVEDAGTFEAIHRLVELCGILGDEAIRRRGLPACG